MDSKKYEMTSDAAPGLNFYYGIVRSPEGDWSSRIIANCQHHHRTRESAERCSQELLRGLKK